MPRAIDFLKQDEERQEQTTQGSAQEFLAQPVGPQEPMNVLPPEADLEAHAAYGRAVTKGLLNIVEGVTTFPAQITATMAEVFNEPALKESADEFANMIRRNMPELSPEIPGEVLITKLVQYGLPAATVFTLVGRVAAGSPTAIRTAAQILGGGFADFMAATPEDDSILAAFGLQEPATTAMQKRLRVGAEGAVAPIVAAPVVIGAIGTIRGTKQLGRAIKAGIRPMPHVEKTISKELQKRAGDVTQAVTNIQKTEELAVGGFVPTAGTATGQPGLIQLEKGVSVNKETAAAMLSRQTENMAAIRQQVESVIGPETRAERAAKAETARIIGQKVQEPVETARQAFVSSENALARSKEETLNLIDDFSLQRGKQADASTVLDDTIKTELNQVTRQKNGLFAAIDPNNQVVVDKEKAREALTALSKMKSKLDTSVKRAKAYLGDSYQALRQIIKKPKKGQKEILLTFGALQDLRPNLSAAISRARAANEGDVVERLVAFKDSIDSYIFDVAEGTADAAAAKRAQDALNFYKDTYVPRFKESTGDAFRKAIRQGKDWPATAVGKKFLSPASGARESANNLIEILKTSPNKEVAGQAIRDHIVSDIANIMTHSKGDATSLIRLDRWMNQRQVKETLDKFPAIKNELMDFRKAVAKGVEQQSTLGEMVQANRQHVIQTEKELQRNAARFFIDREPTKALSAVLGGADPEKGMKQLINYARQDPTGDAVKGLRAALGNYIDEAITTVRAGRLETRQAGMARLLENPRTRNAISQLYNPNELKTLDTVLEQIRVMDRINMQVPAGSPTAKLQQAINEARVVIASMYGIVKGRGIFQISRWIQRAILPIDPDLLAERLLIDAMLDPNLAKTLLMRETPKTRPIIRQRLWTYMLNNIPLEVQEQ